MSLEQDDGQTLSPEMMVEYLRDELAAAEHRVEGLESALLTARRIGAAVGIVMSARKVTESEAFQMLNKASQRDGRKLRDIADDIVLMAHSDLAW